MKLIIGLGNPGKKYKKTRHNAGRMVVDELSAKHHAPFVKKQKLLAEVADIKTAGKRILLAKPLTYMNESGRSARALADFYKIGNKDVVVVHDDKDLPLGEIRRQTNRGAAGHHGARSIIEHLGTENFTRVRVGIAPADGSKIDDTADFVLQKFTNEEQTKLNEIIDKAAKEII